MDIATLKKSLPRGYTTLVVNKFGIKPANLSSMMNERITLRLDIAEYLVDLAEQHKAKEAELQERINNL